MPTATLLATDSRSLITRAVREITGLDTAKPREGQGLLHDEILRAMETRGHFAAQAPTGSGKSIAALAPAFMAAIDRGERTIISTDSLALMGQLQDKDVDTVKASARDLFPDVSVEVAFLKGVSNYLDPERVVGAAQKVTGTFAVDPGILLDTLQRQGAILGADDLGVKEGDEETYRDLILWALGVYARNDDGEHGDRHSCPVEHTQEMWRTVSASSVESSDGKRIGVTPKIEAARIRASEADIVVTNHSMLAVQAAKALAVIVGSTKLGRFDHLIIDEAHTLPNHVRSQGAEQLSGGLLERIARNVLRTAGSPSSGRAWKETTSFLADELDEDLRRFAAGQRDKVRRLVQGEDVIGEHVERLKAWANEGATTSPSSSSVR